MRNRRFQIVLALMLCLGIAPWCLAQEQPKAKRAPGAKPAPVGARYDVMYQVHLPTFADFLAGKIKEGIQKDIANRKPGESDEDYAVRKQFEENVQAALVRCVKEVDNLTLGWKLDRQAKRTNLDLVVTAVKDSELARQFAQLKEQKTAFGGFTLPGAALTIRGAGQKGKQEAEGNVKLVELVRANGLVKIEKDTISDDEKKVRKDLWNKLMDVVRDSAASGRGDAALSVVVRPKGITLVGGGYTADGAKLESVVKPVADYFYKMHPQIGTLKLDAEKYEGVNFHTLAIPAPPGDDHEKFIQVFGESLDLVVGFGKEAVYVAAGRDAMKSLKEAIRKSATPAALPVPFEASLALKPLADFMAVMGKEHEKGPAQMAANVLANAKGKDRVRIVAQPIERGVILRIAVEQGILDLIGAVSPHAKEFLEGK